MCTTLTGKITSCCLGKACNNHSEYELKAKEGTEMEGNWWCKGQTLLFKLIFLNNIFQENEPFKAILLKKAMA